MTITADHKFGLLTAKSARMRRIFDQIETAARTDLPVMIVGETGTGKELVAREIYRRSRRKDAPFIAINCGAVPPDLVASEIFGHARGAFTGADTSRVGRYQEADGGTLFLDEVATMDDRMQVALLRLLETGEFRPIGARQDQRADVRLLCATNEDLQERADRGLFREDLLYRLRVLSIHVPPLRDRVEDIPLLVDDQIAAMNDEYGWSILGIERDAEEALLDYPWPGNIRELRNVLLHASSMAESGLIETDHLPPQVMSGAATEPRDRRADWHRNAPVVNRPAEPGGSTEAEDEVVAGVHFITYGEQPGIFARIGMPLSTIEREYIRSALNYCGNNKTQAAKLLGISRKCLYDKIERWGG